MTGPRSVRWRKWSESGKRDAGTAPNGPTRKEPAGRLGNHGWHFLAPYGCGRARHKPLLIGRQKGRSLLASVRYLRQGRKQNTGRQVAKDHYYQEAEKQCFETPQDRAERLLNGVNRKSGTMIHNSLLTGRRKKNQSVHVRMLGREHQNRKKKARALGQATIPSAVFVFKHLIAYRQCRLAAYPPLPSLRLRRLSLAWFWPCRSTSSVAL